MDQLRIINFHGIGTPERGLDPGESPFWLPRSLFCRVLDRIQALGDREQIAITFDDGNRSDVTTALPELLERGLKATFFIITGRLDQPGSLRRSDLVALAGQGMGLGSHGVGHLDLKGLDAEGLTSDLERSRRDLEALSNRQVRTFAIPFGRYNAKVLGAIRAAGYQHAYTSDGGDARATEFLQPRRSLRGDMSQDEIEAILAGEMPLLRRMRRSVAMGVKRLL